MGNNARRGKLDNSPSSDFKQKGCTSHEKNIIRKSQVNLFLCRDGGATGYGEGLYGHRSIRTLKTTHDDGV